LGAEAGVGTLGTGGRGENHLLAERRHPAALGERGGV